MKTPKASTPAASRGRERPTMRKVAATSSTVANLATVSRARPQSSAMVATSGFISVPSPPRATMTTNVT